MDFALALQFLLEGDEDADLRCVTAYWQRGVNLAFLTRLRPSISRNCAAPRCNANCQNCARVNVVSAVWLNILPLSRQLSSAVMWCRVQAAAARQTDSSAARISLPLDDLTATSSSPVYIGRPAGIYGFYRHFSHFATSSL